MSGIDKNDCVSDSIWLPSFFSLPFTSVPIRQRSHGLMSGEILVCPTLHDPTGAAYQSYVMGFSQAANYWSGLPFPSGIFDPGWNQGLLQCRQTFASPTPEVLRAQILLYQDISAWVDEARWQTHLTQSGPCALLSEYALILKKWSRGRANAKPKRRDRTTCISENI